MCYYSNDQHLNDIERWRYWQFLNPFIGYKFRFVRKVADRSQDLLIVSISAIFTVVNSFCKCSAIIGLHLHDDFYLVASDLIFTLWMPKGLAMTCYNSCSVIICLVQLI